MLILILTKCCILTNRQTYSKYFSAMHISVNDLCTFRSWQRQYWGGHVWTGHSSTEERDQDKILQITFSVKAARDPLYHSNTCQPEEQPDTTVVYSFKIHQYSHNGFKWQQTFVNITKGMIYYHYYPSIHMVYSLFEYRIHFQIAILLWPIIVDDDHCTGIKLFLKLYVLSSWMLQIIETTFTFPGDQVPTHQLRTSYLLHRHLMNI